MAVNSATVNYIKFLLFIDALKETNRENTRTSKKLIQDVEAAWQKIFPDEAPESLGLSTIGRHIEAMNKSGFYEIKTCKNKKGGYYSNRFPFEAAEFCLIAQALYRSVAISKEETNIIVKKFLYRMDDLGEAYLNIISQQIRHPDYLRKTPRPTLPIIREILSAIRKQNKLKFNYYEKNERKESDMKKRKDSETNEPVNYIVSPYFLVWDSNELYMLAHYGKHDIHDTETGKRRKRLSHFKVSLMVDIKQRVDEPTCSIDEMSEFRRYQGTTPEAVATNECNGEANSSEDSEAENKKSALKKFPLDRYLRENLFMFHDDSTPIKLRLIYRDKFLNILMTKFGLDRSELKAYRTGQKFSDGEDVYSATIEVQENEGLYIWLMQQVGYVIVAEPESVRTKLKNRLEKALRDIEYYEQGPKESNEHQMMGQFNNYINADEMSLQIRWRPNRGNSFI